MCSSNIRFKNDVDLYKFIKMTS